MIIKLINNSELTIPDGEKEFVALVDLHDSLNLHECADKNRWSSQCKTCGCQLVNEDGSKYVSLLSLKGTHRLYLRLGAPDMLIMKEAVSRNPLLAIAYGNEYGPSSWLWQFVETLDDAHLAKQLFYGNFAKLCDATEARIEGMKNAKLAYGTRLQHWAERIKEASKSQRKIILARNKEIWQTLKGHYGAERQAMIEELELGIKRRKLLKAKENAAIEKWKMKRHGW